MQGSRRIVPVIVFVTALLWVLPAAAFAVGPSVNHLNGVASLGTTEAAVAVGQGGTLIHTSDGGATWERVGLPLYRDYYDVGFSSSNTKGWAIGDRGQLVSTDDGGVTWYGQLSGTSQPLRALAVVSSSVAYIAGGGPQAGDLSADQGIFLRTTDGGDNWVSSPPTDSAWTGLTPLYEHRFTAIAAAGTEVWLRGEHAGSQIVAVSHDSGSNWTAFAGATTVGDLELTGPGPSNGFAVGGSSVLHTSDSWQTVAAVQHTAAGPLVGLDMLSATNGWAVGDSGGIVHTTDGGAWVAETSGTTSNLKAISASNPSLAWAAGENGALLRTTDSGTTWSTIAGPSDTFRPRCFATARASCYRNHYVTLKYKVTDSDSAIVKVKIKIKTRTGRTVKTLGFIQKPANIAASWRFKCTLKKGSYLYWVYATDLSGNVQTRIGKNSLTVK